MRFGPLFFVVFGLVSLAACEDQVSVDPVDTTDAADSAEPFDVMGLVDDAVVKFLEGSLEPMNEAPRPSVGVPGASVDVWTLPADRDAYGQIDVASAGSGASLEVGAMIVREVLDGDHVVTKLTVLVKGPVEANPELGGWVFGVYTPEGEVMFDEAGEPMVGALPSCMGCHVSRASDDFLFGVP
jgi:hypothetical protein